MAKGLFNLTGLKPDAVAEALAQNPRAYMAVRGAAAEVHLCAQLERCKEIHDLQAAGADGDKDFTIQVRGSPKPLAVECKNAEVMKLGRKELKEGYLAFLRKRRIIKPGIDDVEQLPQGLRESGYPRFQFAASLAPTGRPRMGDCSEWLSRFAPTVTVDFWRSRNSTSSDGTTREPAEALRLYRRDEVHVVAVCLFARTLEWEFVYTTSMSGALVPHKEFKKRFSNKLRLDQGRWFSDLGSALGDLVPRGKRGSKSDQIDLFNS